MKKVLEGYLEINWEDTALYKTEEDMKHLPKQKLIDQLDEFNNKKVRITIEEIEDLLKMVRRPTVEEASKNLRKVFKSIIK